jgi:uncharacterized protein DUF1579
VTRGGWLAVAFAASGCAAPGAAPAGSPAAPGTTAAAAAAPAPSKACAAPEYRQFDFWIGDWDLAVHARSAPTSDQWGEARGHQHVEAILGGCAIAEHFTADGPQTPWAGASYSSWQPALSQWRQTWVDDSGGYLAFRGGLEHGAMTLYGEPREAGGKRFQMRMVFRDVTADSLRWEWQRSDDDWATAAPMIAIDYRRAAR